MKVFKAVLKQIWQKCLKTHAWANKGYTLIEILVTISLMSIIAGTTIITYKNQNKNQTKKNIEQSTRNFTANVANCVTSSGGWHITRTENKTQTQCTPNPPYTWVSADSECKFELLKTSRTPFSIFNLPILGKSKKNLIVS